MARRRDTYSSNRLRDRIAGAQHSGVLRCSAATLALAAILAFAGCASNPRAPLPFVETEPELVMDESGPLGGDALAQRKRDMQRSYRDMSHFHATLESLKNKRKRSASIQLSNFLNVYMSTHLDPLLHPSWQSEHPELMALDANLRLVKAGVMIELRDTRRAQQTLDEIRRRFEGRETMLVEFPVGSQRSLAEALAGLSKRKWRG